MGCCVNSPAGCEEWPGSGIATTPGNLASGPTQAQVWAELLLAVGAGAAAPVLLKNVAKSDSTSRWLVRLLRLRLLGG